MKLSTDSLRELGREVLSREEAGIRSLHRLVEGPEFPAAVELLVSCAGRIVVSGVGKSGIIAQRIAASLRSTGTPADFLHPVEAMHGDLGLVAPGDVGLFCSNSGASEELLRLLPPFQRLAVPIVAATARADSELARAAQVSLVMGPLREAGPIEVVPTTSVTALQVLGDLLVTALYAARGVTASDLAWLHPGGMIGQRLTLTVEDVMRGGRDLPRIAEGASLREAVIEIMEKKLGMTTVVDGEGRLRGVLTDGDLRRAIHRHGRIDPLTVAETMTRRPRTIHRQALVASAVERMERHDPGPITALVVVDEEGRPEGVVHLHDCLRLQRRP